MNSKEEKDEEQQNFKERVAEYQEVFAAFDKAAPGAPGAITADKLKVILEQQLGELPVDEEIKDMIAGVDTDNSGQVDFAEFLTLMQRSTEVKARKCDPLKNQLS